MKYLKSYKLFESVEDLDYNIELCFLPIYDMDINIKYDGYKLPNREEISLIKINLDNRVDTGETATSKWGVKYRPVVNGQEIASEISNSINHCIGLGIKVKWANVRWKNAGEWNQVGKEGIGPGILEKAFTKDGNTGQFENPVKGNYNINDLCDFIESKSDMLRQIEVHFTE